MSLRDWSTPVPIHIFDIPNVPFVYSVVVHNIEKMPHSQLSQPEANIALPNMPSPDAEDVNPSMRKGKKRTRGGRKKKTATRKLPNQHSLSPSASSAGDTPLSLSGVSNKPCAWLTASTDSFNLSDSQLSCHQIVQNSPPHGRKRRHSGLVNSSPEIPAPVAKHARYELSHQCLDDDDSISAEQFSEAPAQVSTSSLQASISSPQAPTSPQALISPPQAPVSPCPPHDQTPVSPQAPFSPPQTPVFPRPSHDQAPISPQAPFSPLQAPISPPQAPISSPQAPVSPPQAPISCQAPFSPPLASEDLQSNCKRKRKSTYTLDESVCGEQHATKEESGEPPSKRVRRATFSVSPKITNKNENEIINTDENTSANVEAHSTEALNGIMDVHSEIMDLLDKRVEKIRKLN